MIIPRSRFGNVPIAIIQYEGEPADWAPDLRLATFHFPGGNVTETQVLGQGAWEVTHLAQVTDTDDFAALLALLGTEQTLRVPRHGVSAYVGDHETTVHGEEVKYFYSVLLSGLSDIERRFDGSVRCSCTFSRAVPS